MLYIRLKQAPVDYFKFDQVKAHTNRLNSIDNICLPMAKAAPVNLRCIGPPNLYQLLLEYSRAYWPDIKLIDDFSLDVGTQFLGSRSTRTISYIRKDGIRYGCTINKKSKVDCYAFLKDGNARVPVEIEYLLVLQVADKPPHICAVIRRMLADGNIPDLPWDI